MNSDQRGAATTRADASRWTSVEVSSRGKWKTRSLHSHELWRKTRRRYNRLSEKSCGALLQREETIARAEPSEKPVVHQSSPTISLITLTSDATLRDANWIGIYLHSCTRRIIYVYPYRPLLRRRENNNNNTATILSSGRQNKTRKYKANTRIDVCTRRSITKFPADRCA